MVKNPAPAPAPAGFAIKIRQNPAPAGFGKSKSGTTLLSTWQSEDKANTNLFVQSNIVKPSVLSNCDIFEALERFLVRSPV